TRRNRDHGGPPPGTGAPSPDGVEPMPKGPRLPLRAQLAGSPHRRPATAPAAAEPEPSPADPAAVQAALSRMLDAADKVWAAAAGPLGLPSDAGAGGPRPTARPGGDRRGDRPWESSRGAQARTGSQGRASGSSNSPASMASTTRVATSYSRGMPTRLASAAS